MAETTIPKEEAVEVTTTETSIVPEPEHQGPILKPPKKKRKWKRWVFLAIVLLLVSMMVYGTIAAALAKPVVLFTPSTAEDIDQIISTSGTISSDQTKSYFLATPVRVTQLNFSRGDQVKKGDVIAVFDLSDLQSSLRKAEIQLENAKLNYEDTLENLDDSTVDLYNVSRQLRQLNSKLTNVELAIANYGITVGDPDIDSLWGYYTEDELGAMRVELATQVGALSAQRKQLRELDMSENAMKQLDNNLETLELTVNDAKRMINLTGGSIVAEFDGVLTEMNMVEGGQAGGVGSVAKIESNEVLKVQFSLNKYDIQSLEVGQEAEVTFGKHVLQGTVDHIDGAATTTATGAVVMATVKVEDPEHLLKLGMEADLDILTDSRSQAVAVPATTVKTDKTGDYVYILKPTTGEEAKAGEYDMIKTYIKVGISDDTYMEVLEGVSVGDLIATVVPKGVEGGIVVNGIEGNSSGGMLTLPGGITIEQPEHME